MRVRVRLAACLAALSALVPIAVAVAGPTATTQASIDPAGVMSGAPIHGIDIYNYGFPGDTTLTDLPRLKLDGINTIVVYIYVHQADLTYSGVESTSRDVSDDQLGKLADAAHQLGMAVEFMPIVVIDSQRIWRGWMQPYSVSSWFHYYDIMAAHYLRLAKSLNVEIFSIGSELYKLQGQDYYWERLASWVQHNYSGITTYQATGGSVFAIRWLRYLDLIGTSPYYSLSDWNEPDPSVSELVYTWQHSYLPKLKALGAQYHRDVFFSEIGYVSAVGATVKPAKGYAQQTPVSQDAQAHAYLALLEATARASWVRGIAWWHWDKQTGPGNGDFSMRDKKAECVVAHYWAHQSPSLPPPVDTTGDVCLANHVTALAS
jgi:hypothetical protein